MAAAGASLGQLPADVLAILFSLIQPWPRLALSRVCKRWRTAALRSILQYPVYPRPPVWDPAPPSANLVAAMCIMPSLTMYDVLGTPNQPPVPPNLRAICFSNAIKESYDHSEAVKVKKLAIASYHAEPRNLRPLTSLEFRFHSEGAAPLLDILSHSSSTLTRLDLAVDYKPPSSIDRLCNLLRDLPMPRLTELGFYCSHHRASAWIAPLLQRTASQITTLRIGIENNAPEVINVLASTPFPKLTSLRIPCESFALHDASTKSPLVLVSLLRQVPKVQITLMQSDRDMGELPVPFLGCITHFVPVYCGSEGLMVPLTKHCTRLEELHVIGPDDGWEALLPLGQRLSLIKEIPLQVLRQSHIKVWPRLTKLLVNPSESRNKLPRRLDQGLSFPVLEEVEWKLGMGPRFDAVDLLRDIAIVSPMLRTLHLHLHRNSDVAYFENLFAFLREMQVRDVHYVHISCHNGLENSALHKLLRSSTKQLCWLKVVMRFLEVPETEPKWEAPKGSQGRSDKNQGGGRGDSSVGARQLTAGVRKTSALNSQQSQPRLQATTSSTLVQSQPVRATPALLQPPASPAWVQLRNWGTVFAPPPAAPALLTPSPSVAPTPTASVSIPSPAATP